MSCSVVDVAGCFDTEITDTLPEPLIFDPSDPNPVSVAISPNAPHDLHVDAAAGEFSVSPKHTLAGETGLTGAGNVTISVAVAVPTTVSGNFNDQTITNTAHATASNAEPVQSDADVELIVETTVAAGIAKSASPSSVLPSVPGRAVDWTMTPSNQSNQNVDQIVVQDPADPTSADPFNYVDYTGLDITAPNGTADTTIEYFDGTDWVTTEPAEVRGVRVTFDGNFAPEASGTIVMSTVTNDAVLGISPGTTLRVPNEASVVVSVGDTDSPTVTDDAAIRVANVPPSVEVVKTFGDSTLISGQETTLDIVATIGAQDVEFLTITEPSLAAASLTEQGLEFTGFSNIEWPEGAVSATIVYFYEDGDGEPLTTTDPHTLPAHDSNRTVAHYEVSFAAAEGTDGLPSSAYANLTMDVTALPHTDPEPRSSLNVVVSDVENTTGQTGDDDHEVPFTISPISVDTTVSKTISPDEIYGVGGAMTRVSFAGRVNADSTIGSEYLTISDPADPSDSNPFWDSFTATSVRNTEIPACSTLTMRYWSIDAGDWVDLPGATNVPGPVTGFTFAIDSALRSDIGGIQFRYEPMINNGCPTLLPPGFSVLPNLDVALRPGVTVDEELDFTNTVQSEVHNPNAIVPTQTDEDDAGVTVIPTGSGPGPDLIDKFWLQDDVSALSGDVRSVRLNWNTRGLPFDEVQIADSAYDGERSNIATSVFDAFDLRAIQQIRPSDDPHIANDRVTKVELFSDDANDWVDITPAACASGCEGRFGGYELSETEQADTIGVRITIEGRDGVVTQSHDDRPITLDFALRDTLRSEPSEYVLGQWHDYDYNTDENGLVNNTARATGFGEQPFTSTDADTILIVDAAVNVSIDKVIDQEFLGLPPTDVDPDDYPLIDFDIMARNTTAARISSMTISDPGRDQASMTAYDVLDVHQIDGFTLPAGLTIADVTVRLDRSGVTETLAGQAALDATPADLADVTSIHFVLGDPDGPPIIESNTNFGVTIVYQLRQEKRSGGPVETTVPGGVSVKNEASVQAESPSRIPCEADGCSDGYADDEAVFHIDDASYGVTTSKDIAREEAYENEGRTYVTSLRARPTGNARTVLMTVTDASPTFWNAMDYVSTSIVPPRPVNQVKMDVLVGADFTNDTDFALECEGDSDLANCWVEGDWQDVIAGQNYTLGLPDGVDAADVLGVRYQARDFRNGQVQQWERPHNPELLFRMTTERREFLRYASDGDTDTLVPTTRPGMEAAPGETQQGRITNEIETHGDATFGIQEYEGDAEHADSTLVRHLTNSIRVHKAPGNPNAIPRVSPQNPVPYVLTIENTGQWDMTGFTVVDQIDLVDGSSPLVEPDPVNYGFQLTGTGAPATTEGFSASLDEATGTVSITTPDDFVFRSGWTLRVNANLMFRPGLSPDVIVTNSVTADSDRDFETCRFSTDNQAAPTPLTNVDLCTSTTKVTPLASAPMSMKKWVKGDGAGETSSEDDLGVLNVMGGQAEVCEPGGVDAGGDPTSDAAGFYTYPCAPVTRPGSEETWRLDFLNNGNTNANIVVAVDRLPDVGDTGVIVPFPRRSEFAVKFRGDVTANLSELAMGGDATLRTYYSTGVFSNACNTALTQEHTHLQALPGGCNPNWVEFTDATPDAELDAAKTVKFVVEFEGDNAGVRPGETLQLAFNTETPWVLPAESAVDTGMPIAYNSFAAGTRTAQTVTQPGRGETVVEPRSVPVATALGQLYLSKDVDAPEFARPITMPSNYPMLIECTSGTEEVDLRYSDGSAANRVSVDADGSLVFSSPEAPVNLPLFANCTVIEDPITQGAEVTYDPTGELTALRSLDENTSIHDPFTTEVEDATISVLNTFSVGGFQVTKAVDNGGAVNQDGDDIVYVEDFSFTASCTFLDQEAIPEDDMEFTLAEGDIKTFTGLPMGSECVVTETDSGLAEVTGDATREFTITEADPVEHSIDFENVYSVGAVTIEKSVTGDGADAWGNEDFVIAIECRLPEADPEVVFSDTAILSKVSPTWQITNLASGANCVVTETATGGANDTDIVESSFTVGDDPSAPTLVAVDNRFDLGAVEVTKALEGVGVDAPPISDGEYTIMLDCYRMIDGVRQDIAIPGGAERVLIGASTELYTGLPTGAICEVTETDSTPPAASVSITPEGPFTVGDDEEEPNEVTVENTFTGGTLQIVKDVTGPGFEDFTTGSFEFTVECRLMDVVVFEDTVLLEAFGDERALMSDVLGPIPTGAECLATESDNGGADTTPEPVTLLIGDDPEPVLAGFVNHYSAGTIELAKELDGDDAAAHRDVEFTLLATCEIEVTLDDLSTVWTTVGEFEVVLRGGESVLVLDEAGDPVLLPLGTNCWLAETDDGDANKVEILNDSIENAVVVEAGSAEEPQELVLTAVNTFTKPVIMPKTGGPSSMWLFGGGGLLLLGALFLLFGVRRTRSS